MGKQDDILKNAAAQLATAKEISTTLKQQNDMLRGFVEHLGVANQRMETLDQTAQHMLSHTEDICESIDDVVSLAKKLEKGFASPRKTVRETLADFERMKTVNEKMLAGVKANSKEAVAFQHNIRKCEQAISVLNDNMGDGTKPLKENEAILKVMLELMKGIAGFSSDFASNMSKINFGPITRGVNGLTNLLGGGGRFGQRIRSNMSRAQDLKDQQNKASKQRATNAVAFDNKKAGLEATWAKDAKFKNFLDGNGQLDFAKIAGDKDAKGEALKALMNPNAGFLDRRMMASSLSGGGRMMQFMKQGGGSIMEGLGLGLEGGIGGLGSKIMGRAVVPMAIAGAVKDVFDAATKQNQEFEGKLAKGGLFLNDEVNGINAFKNAKNNLRAWGLNRHGITTERNLAVANAMNEFGVLTTDVGADGAGTGSMGDIADIVFKQARQLGLNDTEGTTETMKLLQNYQMTMKGTQDFFRTAGRDIKSAGISSTKYLQLIDDITGQFDSMAKSVDNVTNVLRILGRSGTNTFDQMKAGIQGLTGTDKSTEQRAFLATLIERNGSKGSFTKLMETTADNRANQFRQALQEALEERLPGEANKEARDRILNGDFSTAAAMNKRYLEFTTIPGRATEKSTRLSSMLGQALNARNASSAFKNNPLTFAFNGDIGSLDAVQRNMLQLQALKESFELGGSSFGEYVSSGGANVTRSPQLAGLVAKGGQAVGVDYLKQLPNMGLAVRQVGDTVVQEYMDGLNLSSDQWNKYGPEIQSQAARLVGLANQQGIQMEGNDDFAKLQSIKKNPTATQDIAKLKEAMGGELGNNIDELARQLSGDSAVDASLMRKNQITLEKQYELTGQIASSTRTTEDYLKNIQDGLLNMAGTPLSWVMKATMKLADMGDVEVTPTDKVVDSDLALLQRIVDTNSHYKDLNVTNNSTTGMDAGEILAQYRDLQSKLENGKLDEAGKAKRNETLATIRAIIAHTKGMKRNVNDTKGAEDAVAELARVAGLKYDPNSLNYVPVGGVATSQAAEQTSGAAKEKPSAAKKKGEGNTLTINNHGTTQLSQHSDGNAVTQPSSEHATRHRTDWD